MHERRVERGEKPVGRKIGFTNRTIWVQRGLAAPIWGYMYNSTVRYAGAGPAGVDIAHLIQPRIEPEIQLHFARTPPARVVAITAPEASPEQGGAFPADALLERDDRERLLARALGRLRPDSAVRTQ